MFLETCSKKALAKEISMLGKGCWLRHSVAEMMFLQAKVGLLFEIFFEASTISVKQSSFSFLSFVLNVFQKHIKLSRMDEAPE
jgi:hypothetical protein